MAQRCGGWASRESASRAQAAGSPAVFIICFGAAFSRAPRHQGGTRSPTKVGGYTENRRRGTWGASSGWRVSPAKGLVLRELTSCFETGRGPLELCAQRHPAAAAVPHNLKWDFSCRMADASDLKKYVSFSIRRERCTGGKQTTDHRHLRRDRFRQDDNHPPHHRSALVSRGGLDAERCSPFGAAARGRATTGPKHFHSSAGQLLTRTIHASPMTSGSS